MSNWTDIIKTIKKVNQEVIVIDGEETLVVMPFKRFNALLDDRNKIRQMNEEEFLNEINRQVAIWRANQEETVELPLSAASEAVNGQIDQVDNIDNDTFYIEPVEDEGV